MKHRRNKVKREHGIIQNALPWLENLSRLSEVTDIIPGVIDVNRSSERGIVYKYKTQTGCKLLLKSNGSIQEAFVVTKNPESIQEWVEQEFPSDSPATSSEEISSNVLSEASKKKVAKVTSKSDIRLKDNPLAPLRRRPSKKRPPSRVLNSRLKDVEELNIADRLDNSTLKALKHLKQSLENSSN
ncbi:DUF2103 domain-containing protein [Desulfosporosinus sp. BICA1-9]|uniref:DUF2103 domain-containing protein n=1 Tax=Desulfosporosinus sp. BICA1-9 TaxID=1531958 RepID=UPI000A6100B0|nr:DUF2103 domain-containing protein [Desulfosporosinus sp. BICA1-9]HBW36745.1 hypothetical protein [Desulfosporosinus sp.]